MLVSVVVHVEAMNGSGIGHAAAALGLSPHALRMWRDRLEESSNEMDWRSLLHPSARAHQSDDTSKSTTDDRLDSY
jgi:transposase-like protein